jgi:glycosyltransferase involved in cell wall biosynthesis
MNKLFIDLTGASKKGNATFHGGGNYSKLLSKHLIKNNLTWDIKLLLPESYVPMNDSDTLFLEEHKNNVIYIKTIFDYDFPQNSRLFIPLISNVRLKTIKELKKKSLDIYVTIHGVRNIDMVKYDKYAKYYYKGILKRNILYITLRKYLAFMMTTHNLKKYLRFSDFVLTDSNYSLEKITRYSKISNINYFHPTIPELEYITTINSSDDVKNYILFVSGNRIEKNLIRSLVAFQQFKKEYPSNTTKLISTGVTNDFWETLSKIKDLDIKFLKNHVDFVGYVSNTELSTLYRECKYLLYTSLSEGYGLPIIEATKFNKKCICPFGTSVPEVIGSNAIYVNPHSTSSIRKAIALLENNPDALLLNKELIKLITLRNEIETKNQVDFILRRETK